MLWKLLGSLLGFFSYPMLGLPLLFMVAPLAALPVDSPWPQALWMVATLFFSSYLGVGLVLRLREPFTTGLALGFSAAALLVAGLSLPAFALAPPEPAGCGMEGFFRVLSLLSVPWGFGAGLQLLKRLPQSSAQRVPTG